MMIAMFIGIDAEQYIKTICCEHGSDYIGFISHL